MGHDIETWEPKGSLILTLTTSVVYAMISLLRSFRRFEASHSPKKENNYAHLLAKHTQDIEQYFFDNQILSSIFPELKRSFIF